MKSAKQWAEILSSRLSIEEMREFVEFLDMTPRPAVVNELVKIDKRENPSDYQEF